MTQKKSDLATIASVAQLLAIVLVVAGLYFARDVFVPLSLGLLLSFLLSPIVNWMQRIGIPNVVAVVATATLAFVLLAGTFTLMGRELTTLIGNLPDHKDELVLKARYLAGMTSGMGGGLGELATDVTEAIEGAENQKEGVDSTDGSPAAVDGDKDSAVRKGGWAERFLPLSDEKAVEANDGSDRNSPLYVRQIGDQSPLASWATTAGTVLGPLATAGLVTVFALFMLIHREDLRDRTIAVVSGGNYVATTEALDEAGERISRYLVAQTIVNTSYGFVLTGGLSIIGWMMTDDGFPNVILWGLLATCLRYVPYIGPTASAVFPLTMALSVFPGYSIFFSVLALIIVMELISNNILEPWLYGASTGLSAVAVILAAVFWGWLWGPVGLLLSTPLTVCLVVLGRYVPRFKMLSTLLGEKVNVPSSMRFYQRLLSSDSHRAAEMLRQYCHEHDFEQTCDNVIVPTLKRIRADRSSDRLSESDANKLLAMIGGLIEDEQWRDDQASTTSNKSDDESNELVESGDSDQSAESNQPPVLDTPRPIVVGCAAQDLAEALVLNMLRIAAGDSYRIESVDPDLLPRDLTLEIISREPEAVVITILPKGGFEQAAYLCRTLREEGYASSIVICCTGRFKRFDKLFVKYRKAGATVLTTSIHQTNAKISSIVRGSDPASLLKQHHIVAKSSDNPTPNAKTQEVGT